jgi:hypothetical protein
MKQILLFIFLPFLINAQSFTRALQKSNSFVYRNHVYAFGLEQNKNEVSFKIYKISKTLLKADSLIVPLAKGKVENYLDITADTLHHYFNFYFQKADSRNQASLLRLNDSLKLVAKVDNFDATKINGLTSFEDEKYTYKNMIYVIRTSEDSLGKQFYLNQYEVKDVTKPFDYSNKWQFAFEKRHIKTAHVFYADQEIVYVYVNVISGEKVGQWVLKINSQSGNLIKGMRISIKDDKRSFLMSNFYYDKKIRELLVTGLVYNQQQLDLAAKTFNFISLNKQNTMFFTLIDSMDQIITKQEKAIPIVLPPSQAKAKEVGQYQVRIKELKKDEDGNYKAYFDLYKSLGSTLSFLYETGGFFSFAISEAGLDLKQEKLYSNLATLPNLVVKDPKEITGKMELLSINEFDRFLYSWPITDVEKFYAIDELNNPKWILSKTDLKTTTTSFYQVGIGKKGIEHKVVLESSKYNHPNIYKVDDSKLILFNSDQGGAFTLNVLTW